MALGEQFILDLNRCFFFYVSFFFVSHTIIRKVINFVQQIDKRQTKIDKEKKHINSSQIPSLTLVCVYLKSKDRMLNGLHSFVYIHKIFVSYIHLMSCSRLHVFVQMME